MSSRTGTVLVVEDNGEVSAGLAEILEEEGYTTAVVATAEQALEYLRTQRLPELILLDLILPGMSGQEFLARRSAHAVHREIPVVVLSAVCHEVDPQGLGLAACFTKPADIPELLAAIDRILTGAGASEG